MSFEYRSVGDTDPISLGDQWVLVFGGLTRAGNRLSRRAIESAIRSGIDVVWFDGFQETRAGTAERVPLELDDGSNVRIRVYEYAEAEQETFASRLREGRGWKDNPLGRAVWRAVGRPLGQILRPRAAWAVIRDDVRALMHHTAPQAIVYGDEHAITAAWHAGRMWAEVPVVRGLAER